MDDKHAKILCDLELLNHEWGCEYLKMVREDTQPSRDIVREFMNDIRKIIRDNTDFAKIQELIDYANVECK